MSTPENISGTGAVMTPWMFYTATEDAKKALNIYLSTMSPSDREVVLSLMQASSPTLSMNVDSIESRAIDQLLDAWGKNLAEQAERIREEQTSPRFRQFIEEQSMQSHSLREVYNSAAYNTWIAGLPQQERIQEMSSRLSSELVNGVSNYLSHPENAKDNIPFITAGFVIAAGMVTEAMMIDVASTSMVGANPIQSAVVRAVQVMPDLQSTLNLSVNFFAMALVYQTTAEMVKLGFDKGGAPPSEKFVHEYAKGILDQVNGNQINAFVSALVINAFDNGQPVSQERAQQLAQVAKIALLMIATAALYSISTGWLKGGELMGIFDGSFEASNDLEVKVFTALRQAVLQLPAPMQEQIKASFADFLKANPNINTLLNPKKAADLLFTNIPNPEHPV